MAQTEKSVSAETATETTVSAQTAKSEFVEPVETPQTKPTPTIPTPEDYIRNFEKLGYGMFIHWGLYAQLGRGEWVQHNEKIPKDEYMRLKDTFTAERFDADAIARLAKDNGMNYIVLTTRHHDGFSLYDTRGLNDYDAVHSPAKRDLVREYVDACNRHGILPLFYHTTLDWYNEDFEKDFPRYLQYLRDSVELLCTQYGKIGGLWFDGNWSKPNADWEEDELYGMIRKHQPEAMIINNTGLSARGTTGHPEIDSVTFEQGFPTPMKRAGMEKYVAAEMCYTMNAHWGYGRNDLNYKSSADFIKALCACRKVGANLLLNVGPDAEGEIIPMQQEILRQIGRWIEVFGDAIYEAVPSEGVGGGKDFVLRDENHYYFFIHDLSIAGNENVTTGSGSIGARAFSGIRTPLETIQWMDNGEALDHTADPESGLLVLQATGFPYGTNTVVRVAQAKIG